ncbi:TIM barrel protein [Nocardia sp. NPDC005366]|uniref:TIM barrel protein n=1 Tax=Nocardia sp. NPDC005366 TaxID=3156878 RepID=UPI0033A74CD3
MAELLYPMRIAGAPISWGVCEVPGWGRALDPRIVLAEMAALGITATECGPPGYLPCDPIALGDLLDEYGMAMVGGFLATVLHREPERAVDAARSTLARFAGAGGQVLVLAAATGLGGYDVRPALTGPEWRTLITTASAVGDLAAEYGMRAVLHPHVGTHIETEDEVERFLADADLDLCLDTGHLLIGGTDPVRLARLHPDRIGHIHLKDVRARVLHEIRAGRMEYSEAVRNGLYAPLGAGDIDIAALVREMRAVGYRGWYVIEQDTALLAGGSAESPSRDAARSLRYLVEIGAAAKPMRI